MNRSFASQLRILFVLMSFLAIPFSKSYSFDLVGENGKKFVGAIKEVFLQGSIDGQNLFLVYGMGEMSEDLKKELKGTGKNFKADAIKVGKLFNNSNHRNDYVDALGTGVESTKDSLRWIPEGMKNSIKWPSNTLKKIPGSYKVDLDRARDSYYNSDNSVAGIVKYSGWAVWANVKGAYYLIVETPAGAALGILQATAGVAGTILSVPTAFVLHTLHIALKATITGIKVIASGVMMAGQFAYSAVSATVASAATLTVAGGVMLYKGGKWLFVDSLQLLAKPVRAAVTTTVAVLSQQEYAAKLQNFLQTLEWRQKGAVLESRIEKYKSVFEFKVDGKKILTFTTDIKAKMVVLEAATSKRFFKELRNLPEFDGKKKKEVKQILAAELKQILNNLAVL